MKRLPKNTRAYIVTARESYRDIQDVVESRWGRRISKGLISYYRGSRTGRSPPLDWASINPADWDWLVGLYYADGCKFKDGWKHVSVFTLSITEERILEKLLGILRQAGLSPSVYRKCRRRALDIRIYNKALFESLPEKTSRYSPANPLAFVAGLFDGDGFIDHKGESERWVFSQAKYPHLARQVHRIVSRYGKAKLHVFKRCEGWSPIYRISVLKSARSNLKQSCFAQHCVRLTTSANRKCWSRGPEFHRVLGPILNSPSQRVALQRHSGFRC